MVVQDEARLMKDKQERRESIYIGLATLGWLAFFFWMIWYVMTGDHGPGGGPAGDPWPL